MNDIVSRTRNLKVAGAGRWGKGLIIENWKCNCPQSSLDVKQLGPLIIFVNWQNHRLNWPTCLLSSLKAKSTTSASHGPCSPARLSTLSRLCFEANQLIKKICSYSFIKLKFHSAHLVWLLCAQVAGIDSAATIWIRIANSNPSPNPLAPIRCRFPIPFPIPDPIAIVGFCRSVGLFICLFVSCLSPVLCALLSDSASCPPSIVSLFWLPYNCFISPLAIYISASISASVSAAISVSASSVATTSHPWITSKLCCHCHWNS